MDSFGTHLLPANSGICLEMLGADEVDLAALAVVGAVGERDDVLTGPNMWTDLGIVQPGLFDEFSAQRGDMVFAWVEAATWQCPDVTSWKLKPDHQQVVRWRENDGANGLADAQRWFVGGVGHRQSFGESLRPSLNSL